MIFKPFFRRRAGWVMILTVLCTACGSRTNNHITRTNEEGLALLERSEYPAAINVFQKATAKWPREQVLWLNLAYSFDLAGHRSEAMSAYETAFTLANRTNATAIVGDFEGLYLRYAVLALDLRQSKIALEQLQQQESNVQQSPFGNLALGILHYTEEHYADALQALNRAEKQLSSKITDTPSDLDAWLLAVRLATSIKSGGAGAELSSDLAQLNQHKGPPAAFVILVTALIAEQRYQDALPWVEKINQTAPELGRGWHLLALCLEGLNRIDEAVPALQKAFTANSPDREAVVHYAAAMMKRGLNDEALTVLREISATPISTPDSPSIVPIVEVAIASIYAQRGQRLLAQQRVEHALQLDPDLPEAKQFYTKLTGNPPPLVSTGRPTPHH